MVGTGYALLDGAVGGFVFGWLYNMFVERKL
jgi:membrane associated rhomboid family serine protease